MHQPLCAALLMQPNPLFSSTRSGIGSVVMTLAVGEDPAAAPQGAPVGVAVRLCGAAELAAALQLMRARLHPGLAQVTE